MRINARLNDTEAGYLRFLVKSSKSNVSEVIKKAITKLYFETKNSSDTPASILTKSGFIGSLSADENFSESYKELIADSLSSKFRNKKQ